MILVTGATGHVGNAVVSGLASLGQEVAALVRDAEAARRRLPRGMPLRIGDYEDTSVLEKAFAGIGELVLISSDGDADAIMRHHANVIEAARAARIRRITFTSIIDVGEGSPFYYAPAYRDAERRLAACGVPSTIVRCGLYSDFILDTWLAPAQEPGELVLPAGHGLMAPVSRDDVAADRHRGGGQGRHVPRPLHDHGRRGVKLQRNRSRLCRSDSKAPALSPLLHRRVSGLGVGVSRQAMAAGFLQPRRLDRLGKIQRNLRRLRPAHGHAAGKLSRFPGSGNVLSARGRPATEVFWSVSWMVSRGTKRRHPRVSATELRSCFAPG
ncbi:NAD(P)H-binding protein [Mesorhizobium sp. ES1-4]|uniref:NAD(P)H-binding protein n=1 Tax=Mesorhizobium sp. ES1-4 TaxID=2876627 RepID=UPI001CC9F369|nr:NAD(P)H-binding protein [Mesorhizobium sp. ES1-4]MBZ9799342.1 NAD(P)H-binding protein [Mesorhizobium sp. ES1-4]